MTAITMTQNKTGRVLRTPLAGRILSNWLMQNYAGDAEVELDYMDSRFTVDDGTARVVIWYEYGEVTGYKGWTVDVWDAVSEAPRFLQQYRVEYTGQIAAIIGAYGELRGGTDHAA